MEYAPYVHTLYLPTYISSAGVPCAAAKNVAHNKLKTFMKMSFELFVVILIDRFLIALYCAALLLAQSFDLASPRLSYR